MRAHNWRYIVAISKQISYAYIMFGKELYGFGGRVGLECRTKVFLCQQSYFFVAKYCLFFFINKQHVSTKWKLCLEQ